MEEAGDPSYRAAAALACAPGVGDLAEKSGVTSTAVARGRGRS